MFLFVSGSTPGSSVFKRSAAAANSYNLVRSSGEMLRTGGRGRRRGGRHRKFGSRSGAVFSTQSLPQLESEFSLASSLVVTSMFSSDSRSGENIVEGAGQPKKRRKNRDEYWKRRKSKFS